MNQKDSKLLIIDDDRVERTAIIRLLQSIRFSANVCEAETYADATKIAKTTFFDCMLVDYRLTDGDGIEFIRYLQKENISTPVILLTGQGDETVAVEAMKAGAFDYIVKGKFGPETLMQSINSAMRLSEARAEALSAKERALQAEKMAFLGTMIARIAHEINQPLNAIKLSTGVSLYRSRKGEEISQETMKETLSQIYSWCERIERIIQSVRTFIRSESISNQFGCDLNAAITSVLDMFNDKVTESSIHLDLCLCESLPAIRGERQHLESIITNILSNAIQALEDSHQDDKSINISTTLDNKGQIILTIYDNGPGIDPAIADKIFEPFYSTKSSGKGMGLGLSISLAVAKAFGGNIVYQPSPAGGAQFTLNFQPFPDDDTLAR